MQKSREIEEFLDNLRNTEKLVVVEGAKDRKALQRLGVKGIFCLEEKPLYRVVDEVSAISSEVIILTDLDSEGKRLYGRLKTQLQFLGVEVDNYFREFLFSNTKVRQIEGLGSLRPCYPRFAVAAESPVLVDVKDC